MTDMIDRPQDACILHRPPLDNRSWVRADPGYRTCSGCLDRLRQHLREVADRYARLDPSPGASGDHGRGAPGFGSRSPASDHIIAMTDPRSSRTAKAWVGGDGRVHCEAEHPPLSVHGELNTLAWVIADERGIAGPDDRADVPALVRWIDAQLDWATRCELCSHIAEVVRGLLAQLRPVTGAPKPRYIGSCPTALDDDTVCGTRLYAPLRGDTISCRGCGRRWSRPEWLHLGQVLQEAS